jgi:Tfp pilus assembly protein PilF
MHDHRYGPGLGALLLGMACLAGCHPFQYRPGRAPLLPGSEDNPVALNPSQVADVKVALGRTLEKRGEEGQAIASYSEALQEDPSRADACVRLAVLSDQQGKFDESAKWYDKALKLQPDNPDIYCDVGYSFSLQQRWTDAEKSLRRALALKPDHRRARNNLGLVLARTGRSAEALAEFRRAGCTEAEAHANLGFALTLQGSWSEARQQYELALGADPSSAGLKKEIKELDRVVTRVSSADHPVGPADVPPPGGGGLPSPDGGTPGILLPVCAKDPP